jgi:hypothetical protein
MSEQQKDFKNIMFAFKSGKYTPQQLGSLFKQYYSKHLSSYGEVQTYMKERKDLDIFDGGLPLTIK